LSLNLTSYLACKLTSYFSCTFSSCSALILMYISFYRFISIRFTAKSFTLKKTNTQLIFIFIIALFDFVYYSPVLISFDLVSVERNGSFECKLSKRFSDLVFFMDLSYKFIFVSLFMLLFSVLLIYCIFSSRRRVSNNLSQNRNLKKDIRLSITSILLNILYISLILPVFISFYVYNDIYSDFRFIISYYIFYLNFSINFYTLIASNSLFRKEFLALLVKKAASQSINQ
jgi:hypothetical protein